MQIHLHYLFTTAEILLTMLATLENISLNTLCLLLAGSHGSSVTLMLGRRGTLDVKYIECSVEIKLQKSIVKSMWCGFHECLRSGCCWQLHRLHS